MSEVKVTPESAEGIALALAVLQRDLASMEHFDDAALVSAAIAHLRAPALSEAQVEALKAGALWLIQTAESDGYSWGFTVSERIKMHEHAATLRALAARLSTPGEG